MQQADDVSSYALEDRPRIHGVRSLMSYSSCMQFIMSKRKVQFSNYGQVDKDTVSANLHGKVTFEEVESSRMSRL